MVTSLPKAGDNGFMGPRHRIQVSKVNRRSGRHAQA